jgi:mannose-6-phosphate isomerase-like protein (cupin superfamily)
MQLAKLRRGRFFDVVLDSPHAQCATMTLKPGQCSSDEIENEHPKAEQWVYVVAGRGEVRTKAGTRVSRRRIAEGSIVLVDRDEPHQIAKTGDEPLVTVNIYVPPAYTAAGEVKKSVEK